MSGFRLDKGGAIDRKREVGFQFDGKTCRGFSGDTLASALIANGVGIVGRSFKYHRPRGVMTAGSEEPNALVELHGGARREPNCKATTVELYDGLESRSQNRWPSLRYDFLAMNQIFARFIGAGFYYKTFMWPAHFWEQVYEPLIRRAAGPGAASQLADPDRYERSHAFCDVLVIGAGPAGLAAAATAARSGARVILADDDFRAGGRLSSETCEVDGDAADAWAQRVIGELASNPRVRFLPRTTVFGVYDGGVYGALEKVSDHFIGGDRDLPRQRSWKIVAKRTVLAAGATERPIAFGDNDRPGVMLAGAVRSYIHRFAAAPGRRIGVLTACDDGWRTAFACARAGIETAFIADLRVEVAEGLLHEARRRRVITHRGANIHAVRSRAGVISGVDLVYSGGGRTRVDIDCLAVSGGWNPTIALAGHLGARPTWNAELACFLANAATPGLRVVGAANGKFGLHEALREGTAAGANAGAEAGFKTSPASAPRASDEPRATAAFWHLDASRGTAFVDFHNDVTSDDIGVAHRDGYRAVELLKRYTTLGMGADQGRTGNVTGLAIMAALSGQTIEATGVTTARPPFSPVAIGALAGQARGRHFRPVRRTPAHDWAAANGARFMETGLWLRAQCFLREGEIDVSAAAAREAQQVRAGAGFCDVSTLGKFEIFGPDAATFLDRIYANPIASLAVGRARYVVMLREDGFVFDDGTLTRLAPSRFLASSSTANAARVYEHLEFCRQVLWPELAVRIICVTEQWAQFSLAGPHARTVLADVLDAGEDISNAALPFLGARAAILRGGVRARLFRISFSGELAYEIAAPAEIGDALAQMLEQAGAQPYGLDALDILRIEKGHVSDSEINGQTTAFDLGLSRMFSPQKDFIGRAMAARAALCAPARRQLVGVRALTESGIMLAGAHLCRADEPPGAQNDEGHVASAAYSPHVGRHIGLALLQRGRTRVGEVMACVDRLRGYETPVQICNPAFIDETGERARG